MCLVPSDRDRNLHFRTAFHNYAFFCSCLMPRGPLTGRILARHATSRGIVFASREHSIDFVVPSRSRGYTGLSFTAPNAGSPIRRFTCWEYNACLIPPLKYAVSALLKRLLTRQSPTAMNWIRCKNGSRSIEAPGTWEKMHPSWTRPTACLNTRKESHKPLEQAWNESGRQE